MAHSNVIINISRNLFRILKDLCFVYIYSLQLVESEYQISKFLNLNITMNKL